MSVETEVGWPGGVEEGIVISRSHYTDPGEIPSGADGKQRRGNERDILKSICDSEWWLI